VHAAKRRTFSLDIKLDPCHLPVDDRSHRSLGNLSMDHASKMMTASLEAPLIDAHATTPKLGYRGASSRRCRGTAGRRGLNSCSPSPRFNGQQCAASPHLLPQRRSDCGFTHEGSGKEDVELLVVEQPITRANHPGRKPDVQRGRKPDLQRVRDAQEAIEAESRMHEEREEEDEWDDSDWEDEARAEIPDGTEMDGLDVGCVPSKVLELPQPALPALATGMYGRSMFTSQFAIPVQPKA